MNESKSEQLPLKDVNSTTPTGSTSKLLAEVTQDGNKNLRSIQKCFGATIPSGFPKTEIVKNQQFVDARDLDPPRRMENPPRRVENPDDGAMAPRKEKEEERKNIDVPKMADQVLSNTSPAYAVGKWLWRKLK